LPAQVPNIIPYSFPFITNTFFEQILPQRAEHGTIETTGAAYVVEEWICIAKHLKQHPKGI
jgi:hypothetical protein